jgi:hypothetical protein
MDKSMTRLDELISQLDGLVVLLAAAHEEVFDVLRKNEMVWFPASQNPRLPTTVEGYKASICHSAFLLGYAHFESFLADLAKKIYARRPSMLPKDRTMKVDSILSASSKEDLVDTIISIEIRNIFAGPIEETQKHFQVKLQLNWSSDQGLDMVEASRIRNCLMHNGALVDDRLAACNSWTLGSSIRLDASRVHGFGIGARSLARSLWQDAYEKHLRDE